MTDANSLNVSLDVVWPTIIILAMLVINGFVFAYIMRKRREYKNHEEEELQQQQPVPHTSYAATSPTERRLSADQEDDGCAIQMERL
ncbi:uncharacterized protein LOC26526727 [Drosophila erecta]|uniref:Uncharacterized protein n=1 Tax=Drosophila erecta TaxID=7220 RepID=A0A0Q5VMR1_DROER|nr:uncharacterized protein LOC26526727 [Drosophila erecta]KQS62659.1 uncharacterized protein Dere_GG26903 [Drosophila erecta]